MNITLFVDADNISYLNFKRIIDKIKEEQNEDCNINTKIFGSFSTKLLNRWKKFTHECNTVEFINIPIMKKKNITDHVIIVSAMKCLYTTDMDIFALASDDVDFFPLYEVLRENKKIIWQISQNIEGTKYLDSYVDLRIDVSNYSQEETDLLTDDKLNELIEQAFTAKEINGVALLGDVKYWMDTNIDGFSMSSTRFNKFSKLIKHLNQYEMFNDESEFKIKKKENN